MINLKSSVYSAMLTSTAIQSLVSSRIHFHYPDSFVTLPCISYFEMNNSESFHADNVEVESLILFRVDLWGTDSLSTLALAVDDVMKGEGFFRIGSVDLFEQDTNIFHKSVTYQNNYIDTTF